MKKIVVFLLFIPLLVCNCNKLQHKENFSDVYFVNEGLLYSYYSQCGHPETKSSCRIEPINKSGKTIMYMVNHEDGWELFSADMRISAVIAKGEGSISYHQLSSNPITAYLFSSIEDNILAIRESKSYENNNDLDAWEKVLPSRGWSDWIYVGFTDYGGSYTAGYLAHLMSTKWGQGTPWNVTSPIINGYFYHANTGCVMVALAQVLYYLHGAIGEPVSIYGSCSVTDYVPYNSYLVLNDTNTSFYNLSSTYWQNIPLSSSDVNGTNHYPVSTLMTRLGFLLGASYVYDSNTYAQIDTIPQVLSSEYGISCEASSADMDEVFDQITNNHMPCIMGITSSDTTYRHAVVVDGYKRERRYGIMHYIRYNTDNGSVEHRDYSVNSLEDYACINWGYDGAGDGSLGSPIWYNTNAPWVSIDGIHYSLFSEMVYDFRVESDE